MKVINSTKLLLLITLLFNIVRLNAHPIDDYFKNHKNDSDMESKVIPPKIAAQVVDKDYPEAIEVLKSMTTLRYLNYYGELSTIQKYAKLAISAAGNYPLLLEKKEEKRKISIFGIKKKGTVRRLFAVVETTNQFILMIGRGKLTHSQIQYLPILAKEL